MINVDQPNRCEIPTSTGAYCHLKEKIKNELVDLEILSKSECDDPELMLDKVKRAQIRREEEEKFYRGENVSWWSSPFSISTNGGLGSSVSS
jgi:hypothetical protein